MHICDAEGVNQIGVEDFIKRAPWRPIAFLVRFSLSIPAMDSQINDYAVRPTIRQARHGIGEPVGDALRLAHDGPAQTDDGQADRGREGEGCWVSLEYPRNNGDPRAARRCGTPLARSAWTSSWRLGRVRIVLGRCVQNEDRDLDTTSVEVQFQGLQFKRSQLEFDGIKAILDKAALVAIPSSQHGQCITRNKAMPREPTVPAWVSAMRMRWDAVAGKVRGCA